MFSALQWTFNLVTFLMSVMMNFQCFHSGFFYAHQNSWMEMHLINPKEKELKKIKGQIIFNIDIKTFSSVSICCFSCFMKLWNCWSDKNKQLLDITSERKLLLYEHMSLFYVIRQKRINQLIKKVISRLIYNSRSTVLSDLMLVSSQWDWRLACWMYSAVKMPDMLSPLSI